MRSYSRSHLADPVLLRTLAAVVTQDRVTTAELLALIAEVDRRRLFRGEGYPSMFRYCVEKLGMSEDVAYKRIQTARAARQHPGILSAIADGRLHLTAVVLLKPYLTRENAHELLACAAAMTKAQVELLIAERFPRADVPALLRPVVSPSASADSRPTQDEAPVLAGAPSDIPQVTTSNESQLVPEPVALAKTVPNPPPMEPLEAQRRVAPLSPGRFELRLTISQQLHDKLRRAQELLGHAVPSGDIPQLLERALDELIAKQEKSQFAAAEKPRRARKSSPNARHIAAHVKREVRKRDAERCTFVSADGHRCESRRLLQYDHIVPVARGGRSTADNLRLRCAPHNQLEAERTFGAGFMEEKRTLRPQPPRQPRVHFAVPEQ